MGSPSDRIKRPTGHVLFSGGTPHSLPRAKRPRQPGTNHRPDRSVDRAGPPEAPAAAEGVRGLRPERSWMRPTQAAGRPSGDFMVAIATAAPSREDFAALLEESFTQG